MAKNVIERSDAAKQSTSALDRTGVDCFPLRKLAVAMTALAWVLN